MPGCLLYLLCLVKHLLALVVKTGVSTTVVLTCQYTVTQKHTSMNYDPSQGGSTLTAVLPGNIQQEECQILENHWITCH